MEITQERLLALLGAKEVEIYLLREQVRSLQAALEAVTKPELPVGLQ